MEPIISAFTRDCTTQVRGRKKWWADRLEVPPLTISHWLSGRQRPNGTHALVIREILAEEEEEKKKRLWVEHLWDCYYSGQEIPSRILSTIILEILSLPAIESRTLALLLRLLEKQRPSFETVPSSAKMKNRLGWLLTAAGLSPAFHPDRKEKPQLILPSPAISQRLEKHFRRYQTPLGKQWRIYDCLLDTLKDSLP